MAEALGGGCFEGCSWIIWIIVIIVFFVFFCGRDRGCGGFI